MLKIQKHKKRGNRVHSYLKTFTWFLMLLLMTGVVHAQTTGKIVGIVHDATTGTPLPGTNIIIEGTTLGAAADLSGDFYIINVPPGRYTLVATMIGYKIQRMEGVVVSVNRTANVEILMSESVIEGEEVVVTAKKISIKKDQTSSIKKVSAEQISILPVESLADVVEMQTGVVNGHFRGGRQTEVSYLVDGMQINEAFNGTSQTVELETDAIQDLEVITGTFNAEYGRAMSGIVNAVTKDGRNQFHGSFSSHFSNYYTTNDDLFIGLKSSEITRNQDYKVQLEGPIWKNKITFFTNIRFQDNKGHLNGIRRYNVDDYTYFTEPIDDEIPPLRWDTYVNGDRYYSEHTGDGKTVPLYTNKAYSFLGKLSFKLSSNLKVSLMHTWNKTKRPFNDNEITKTHSYKYKPDGMSNHYNETKMYMFQMNHLINRSAFHDLKVSYTDNSNKIYLYEDPLDSRYVHHSYSRSAGGFKSGGQDYQHSERYLKDLNVKYDITWQVNKEHSLKLGVLYTKHDLQNEPTYLRSKHEGTPLANAMYYDSLTQKIIFYPYDTEILPEGAISMDRYSKKPYEFSGYIQDKMEFDAMVINFGLRYDYFNSNTTYPTQRRNPANQLEFADPERMSTYPKAKPQVQLSPRFGLSYTLGKSAILHFSYGHFFQMPPLYALYENYRFMVPPNNFGTVHGNPNIKAEKTVQYEMGIWQQVMEGLGIELSVFYRDIYDLQSAKVWTTYNQIKYGVYSNKDYGNAKGLECKLDYVIDKISFFLNYTLQYTRGNADDPKSTYTRAGQSLDPIPRLVPLAWDQRHTLNMSVAYNVNNWGVNLTGYYNSGLPYSYKPVSISPLAKQTLYPNNATRPSTYNLDLKGHYDFDLAGSTKLRLFLSVYNLLDRKNEIHVNNTTGRAGTSVVYPIQELTFISDYNDIYDSIKNPAMFSTPREIKVGVGYVF